MGVIGKDRPCRVQEQGTEVAYKDELNRKAARRGVRFVSVGHLDFVFYSLVTYSAHSPRNKTRL